MNALEIRLNEQIISLITLALDFRTVLTSGKKKWKMATAIARFLLKNFDKGKKAFTDLIAIGQKIPTEPDKLRAFVFMFNKAFDIEDDKREKEIEETLLFLVAVRRWILIFK